MTIKECIDIVDSSKPNQYTIKDKVIWLSFVEGVIINEVLKTHEGYDGRYDLFDGYTEDNLTITLIVPSPYDRLYTAYLKMKIDQENGETARYNNSMMMYNTYMLEWRKHYNKTHMPIDVTSKAKHMMPPKTSSAGLSEAEFESLKRELTYIMTQYFGDSVSEDKIYQAVYNYVQNNIELLKGRDGYTPIKGVDYWTDAEIEAIAEKIRADVGVNSTELKAMLNLKADKSYVKEIEAIAKGRASGYVFDTYEDMTLWLAKPENVNELTLGDNLYIRATNVPDYWWDGSSQQQLETQKVDLTEYVKKEDGYGLSETRIVRVLDAIDLDTFEEYISMYIELQSGVVEEVDLFNKTQISKKLEEKANKKRLEVEDTTLDDEYFMAGVPLRDNCEVIFVGALTDATNIDIFEQDGTFIGLHSSFIFTTGDTVPVIDNDSDPHSIKWVGDDCNSEGVFTPQPNTTYEVDIKCISVSYSESTECDVGTYVARVGAC